MINTLLGVCSGIILLSLSSMRPVSCLPLRSYYRLLLLIYSLTVGGKASFFFFSLAALQKEGKH